MSCVDVTGVLQDPKVNTSGRSSCRVDCTRGLDDLGGTESSGEPDGFLFSLLLRWGGHCPAVCELRLPRLSLDGMVIEIQDTANIQQQKSKPRDAAITLRSWNVVSSHFKLALYQFATHNWRALSHASHCCRHLECRFEH